MAFFPLANTKKANGYCTLHNYSPNNWEPITKSEKKVWAIYSDGEKWITKYLDKINAGESKTYKYDDVYQGDLKDSTPLILLQFRKTSLPKTLNFLPDHEFKYNKTPEWRATVGFSLNKCETSYQGEINPFPPKASLLTFHPFIQYKHVDNYFIFLNVEKKPHFRKAEIEIFEANSKKLIDKVEVKNNHSNFIPLNLYNFLPDQLPIFICRSMAGIPFGFGISKNKDMLSLEHTHPPASFSVHGERFKVQGEIKNKWFNKLKQINE